MPLGPGKLQKAILDKLHSYGLSSPPILLNRLLWDLAVDRGQVHKTGNTFGTDGHVIEEGIRKKSFEINFRRAVKELQNSKKVSIISQKLSDIDEILTNLPFITDKLEVFTLRTELLPTVRKFIIKENPIIVHRDFDPFGYQIKKLRADNKKVYRGLVEKWETIETEIVNYIQDTNSARFDNWIEVLMWGRYYFKSSRNKYILNLPSSVDTKRENEIIEKITSLIEQVEPYIDFKVGNAKKVLYTLFNAPKFGKTTISDRLKHFLFKEKENFLRSLPKDEDTSIVNKFGNALSEYNLRNRQFSPLLDLLFTRHVFRKLSFVNID